MKAFNNDNNYKQQLLDGAKAHRLADSFIKGTYHDEEAENFRGCSVGCVIHTVNELNGKERSYGSHEDLAEALHIPVAICYLQDTIFEHLPSPLHTEWTERMLKAIPAGADLSLVVPRFLLKTLDRLPETDRADVVDCIKGVKEVLIAWGETGSPNTEAAARAAGAAEAAAGAAAWAAGAAAGAAAEAAEAAARAAEAAAWAAGAAAGAAWAARAACWEQIANDLIETIEGMEK